MNEILRDNMRLQMDLGVGSFVFSQGVVSAIPLLKDPLYLIAPSLSKLVDISRKVLPLFFLGMIRVISVKGTEYPVRIYVSFYRMD